jgi:glycosyltransferase involved in cell wall biosynthesis
VQKAINVFVATEQRFLLHDKHFYAEAAGGRDFWQRYLDVFSKLTIVARAKRVSELPTAAMRVDTDKIRLAALPFYIGPFGAITRYLQISKRMQSITSRNAAFIIRIPGLTGTIMHRHLRARGWPYGVELVGDPRESLSPKAIGKPWPYLVRPMITSTVRQQCKNAVAASYVTKHALQQRYPTNAAFSTHYSSVELTGERLSYSHSQRTLFKESRKSDANTILNLIFVGSLAQRYKGLHVLLEAIRYCESAGIVLRLTVLGDGAHRKEYEELVDELNLSKRVLFAGYKEQGEDVLRCLAESDLFVMPSLVEGLPRAMIEAMACYLPCIGSDVGGIPELLPAEYLVPPGDSKALAAKISAVLKDPERMKQAGERNRAVALEYRSDELRGRRNALYKHLQSETLCKMQEARRPDARTACC